MITIGIDSGSWDTKVVVLKDGEIVGKAKVGTDFNAGPAAAAACELALSGFGMEVSQADRIVATGLGRNQISFVDAQMAEITAAAIGAIKLSPEVRMVADIGAEACRAVRLNQNGSVEGFEVNDRCASGSGTFIETMARALAVPKEELGAVAMRHTQDIPMSTQCVVFAESEVISLIHKKVPVEDIAHSILNSVASRISTMIRKLGLVEHIMLIGGPSKSVGLVACLGKSLGREIIVPEDSEYVSAMGAAVYAARTLKS